MSNRFVICTVRYDINVMLAASFIIVWALRTTMSWVGEALCGLVDGVSEGFCGNNGQESNDGPGPSFVGVGGDGRSMGTEGQFEGGSEIEEDWDPEMVAGGLSYLSDTFTRTRGYSPCWRSPFEQSFRGYRIYFYDGSWTDVNCARCIEELS